MSEKPEALIYADMLEVSVEEYSAQGVNWREALRLGNLLEDLAKLCNAPSHGWQLKAAAELRRLHADNERLRELLNRLEYDSEGYIQRYPEEEEVKAALRREET